MSNLFHLLLEAPWFRGHTTGSGFRYGADSPAQATLRPWGRRLANCD